MNEFVGLQMLTKTNMIVGGVVSRKDAHRVLVEFNGQTLPPVVSSVGMTCRHDTLGFSVLSEQVIAVVINAVDDLPQRQQGWGGHGFGGRPSMS